MFSNTCKSTLLTHFLEKQLFYKKSCRLPPTYKFELCSSWFSINHRNIDNHFTYEKVSCLKWVLRKRRYTQSLLLKYAIKRVVLYLLARVLGKECVSRSSRVHVYYIKKPKPLASIVPLNTSTVNVCFIHSS